jgi:DUF1009 family protein
VNQGPIRNQPFMTETAIQRIGLIAGAGDVPLFFANKARERGIRVVAVSLSEDVGKRLAPLVEKNYNLPISQAGKIRNTLLDEGLTDLIIMGKVEKSMIFRLQMPDVQTLKILGSLKSFQDKDVMMAIIHEVEDHGGTVLNQREFMPELFPEAGVLGKVQPSRQVQEDIEFGLPIARWMADREIGQTLVVKNRSVIAVEAVEGTDETIRRGCALSKGGCTVIKVSRTDQDYRFDSPGAGMATLENMAKGKAAALAVEAGRVMLINREEMVDFANQSGLSLLSI